MIGVTSVHRAFGAPRSCFNMTRKGEDESTQRRCSLSASQIPPPSMVEFSLLPDTSRNLKDIISLLVHQGKNDGTQSEHRSMFTETVRCHKNVSEKGLQASALQIVTACRSCENEVIEALEKARTHQSSCNPEVSCVVTFLLSLLIPVFSF